jgi:putative SOS response-associated peptidase YedK
MCGRYTLAAGPEYIADYFHIDGPIPEFLPSWNITPGGDIPVICQAPDDGRTCSLMHWGLIPHWAKAPDSKYKMINAKAETLSQRPAYRDAYKHRRCLIPANGFYEWHTTAQGKQPYYIHRKDDGLLAFAGLWEYWEREHIINSCTIITTTANPLIRSIHDRMPVILNQENYDSWLDPHNTDTSSLVNLLGPCDNNLLDSYRISTAVNNPAHDTQTLIDRID